MNWQKGINHEFSVLRYPCHRRSKCLSFGSPADRKSVMVHAEAGKLMMTVVHVKDGRWGDEVSDRWTFVAEVSKVVVEIGSYRRFTDAQLDKAVAKAELMIADVCEKVTRGQYQTFRAQNNHD